MKFWIYLERELSDLILDFETIFGIDNLYRDYENVWEWITSSDTAATYDLNISRTHNWEKGNYDKPIIIIVKSEDRDSMNEVEIALRIKHHFKCDVYAGEIKVDSDDNPIFGKHRTY